MENNIYNKNCVHKYPNPKLRQKEAEIKSLKLNPEIHGRRKMRFLNDLYNWFPKFIQNTESDGQNPEAQ